MFNTQRSFEPISPSLTFSFNLMLWVFLTVRMSVFVPHCWISSFRTPLAGGHCYYCYCCSIPPINNFKLHVCFWKPIFTTQRYFKPISPSLTFAFDLMLWGFLTVRMSVFVPHCWIPSFRTPLAGGHYCCYYCCCYCKIRSTNIF